MRAYRQYWLLTALLLSAVALVIYSGVIGWALEKFPQLETQVAFAAVIGIFVWTFALRGHRTARKIAHNERALDKLARGAQPALCEATLRLAEARMLRNEGIREAKQTDFSMLHERQVSAFEDTLSEDLTVIDSVKLRMLVIAIFLAFLSIVSGIGAAALPTNVESVTPFLFGLLKALGLAYVPGLACFGSFLILHELGNFLGTHVRCLCRRFDLASYRVAVIGRAPEESLSSRPGG